MKKKYHLSDILSIVPGKLVSTRHMEGVYDILNFMTQDNLFTHQLPRASRECGPYLIKQFPWLVDIDGSVELTPENYLAWVDIQIGKYGEWHEVETIPKDDHIEIDPALELIEMVGDRALFITAGDDPK